MINEKRSFSEAVLEEAQGITFDVVDACEEMSCGEGRLCELHEPLFLETCLILEDSKRLKAANEVLLKALQEIHADTKGRGVWRPFFARIQRIARAALAVAEAKL